MEVPDHFVLECSGSKLVFGLAWHPVLGTRPERLARRLARRFRATHSVVSGAAAASLGLAVLPTKRPGRIEPPMHSAAQALTSRHGLGTAAFVYELESGMYWLLAVHEGAVVARTDCLFPDIERADTLLAELRKAHPKLEVLHFGDPQVVLPSIAEIASLCGSHSSLRKEGWTQAVWSVPRWVLGLAGALVIGVLVFSLLERTPAQAQAGPDPDEIQQLWKEAVNVTARQVGLHGVHGSYVLLKHLYALPTRLGGWALKRVDCTAQLAAWQCQAHLERDAAQAQNAGLIDAAPKHWDLDFISMERARSSWSWAVPELPLKQGKVQHRHVNQRVLQSALQLLKPAFNDIKLGTARALEIAAPLDAEGNPYPEPAGLERYASRAIRVDGPLRSVSLLLPHLAAIRWKSASLSISDAVQPGLAASRLTLSVNGDLYEIIDQTSVSFSGQAVH